MNSETLDRVVNRIQKLRRLSESQNVHEAAAAAAESQRLMTEHRISEAQIQSDAGEIDEPVVDVDVLAATGFKTPQSWLVTLAGGIARANGCRITIIASRRGGRDGKIKMWGQKANLDAATYLFHAMRNEIARLADGFDSGGSRAATLSFKLGAASEISGRMLAEKEAAMVKPESAPTTAALLVINRAEGKVEAAVDKVCSGRHYGTSGPSNVDAFRSGRQAGSTVAVGARGHLGAPPKQIGSR